MNNLNKNKNIGIFLIVISALFFSLMGTAVKSVNHFPLVQKIFFRNFIGLVFLSIFVIKDKTILKVNNKRLMLSRCVCGVFSVFFYYKAISLLDLSEAVVLNKTSPFFVIVLGGFILKEKIRPIQLGVILLALTGVFILLKPQFNIDLLPALIGITSGFFAGSSYTIIRQLRTTDKPITIVFYFCLFTTLVTIPFLPSMFLMPDSLELLSLSMIGILAVAGQFCMTSAYRYAPASQLSIYTYLNIVFSSILGLLFYGESLTLSFLIGAGLIIIAGYINFLSSKEKIEKVKNKPALLSGEK